MNLQEQKQKILDEIEVETIQAVLRRLVNKAVLSGEITPAQAEEIKDVILNEPTQP